MGKTRTEYSKKRKFYGNRHVSCKKIRENEEISTTGETTSSTDTANDTTAILPVAPSASARKIGTPEPQRAEITETEAKGFRFIDLGIL